MYLVISAGDLFYRISDDSLGRMPAAFLDQTSGDLLQKIYQISPARFLIAQGVRTALIALINLTCSTKAIFAHLFALSFAFSLHLLIDFAYFSFIELFGKQSLHHLTMSCDTFSYLCLLLLSESSGDLRNFPLLFGVKFNSFANIVNMPSDLSNIHPALSPSMPAMADVPELPDGLSPFLPNA